MSLPDPPGSGPDLPRPRKPLVVPLLSLLSWMAGSLVAYRHLGYYPPKASAAIFAAWPVAMFPVLAVSRGVKSPDASRSLVILLVGGSFLVPNAALAFIPSLKQLETHPIPGRPTFVVAASPKRNWNLFLIRGSNDDVVQLTDTPQTEGDADLSPDGRRIAFSDDRFGTRDVFVANLLPGDRLGEEHRLTDALGNEEGVTWSPDGTSLLFQHRTDISADIWTIDLDGGPPVALTRDGFSWNPSWSPDGTQIAYAASRLRNPDSFDVWTMRSDGTDPRRLIDVGGDEFGPVWSPDGSLIEFTSDVGGSEDVWMVGADGTNPRSLTPESPDDDFSYAWSEDGAYVLFTSDRSDTGGRFLYFLPVSGGETKLAVIL